MNPSFAIIAEQRKFWLNMLIRGERDDVKRWFVGRYLPELPDTSKTSSCLRWWWRLGDARAARSSRPLRS